tara:strand:+ start:2994 stop:3851 length:858 start_codon:yes stop_codon:yes gene_type:complete
LENKLPIIFKTISSFLYWRKNISGSVGFVATMGGIHKGHLSLVKKSLYLCDFTIVSIFLNPLQFGKKEDLNTYPSNIKKDLQQLYDCSVSAIFMPSPKEFFSSNFSMKIIESHLSNCLEGQKRPDFFPGVLTIITKLFNVVSPTYAFFGKKDPQQLLIIKKLCKDFNFNIKIIACSTIREKNGLAMSSRNEYLTKKEKADASIIYKSIQKAQFLIQNGVFSVSKIKKEMKDLLLTCPNLEIDYISFSACSNLIEYDKIVKKNSLISVAVFIGKTRLIDSFFHPEI